MEPQRIAIRLTVSASSALTHQLRNCAEDISRSFREVRYAEVENMDSAVDTVWVCVQSAGKLNAAMKVIEQCIAGCGMSERCVIDIEGA